MTRSRTNVITEVRIRREPCPVIAHHFGAWVLAQARAAGIDTQGLAPPPLPTHPAPGTAPEQPSQQVG